MVEETLVEQINRTYSQLIENQTMHLSKIIQENKDKLRLLKRDNYMEFGDWLESVFPGQSGFSVGVTFGRLRNMFNYYD